MPQAMHPSDELPPTLDDVREARSLLGERVRETPVWRWDGLEVRELFGPRTEVYLKLELFQYGGSFKPRGALVNMLSLSAEELAHGVTAVSAGNHAIAVAFAAKALGTSAKVVMMKNANPARVAICRDYGAELILAEDVHLAFDEVERIQREEGRFFVHPFEGRRTVLGTATVGFELMSQVADLDAVVVPIGGGGLCAGVATAVKLMNPRCEVFGVEPVGADTMHRSFAAGKPMAIDKVRTIADSLGAPYAAPYSFALCHKYVDELVKVDDMAMRRAMGLLFSGMKLAVEPAGASATAALAGPLRERLAGRRVGLVVCGTNIDFATFSEWVVFPSFNQRTEP